MQQSQHQTMLNQSMLNMSHAAPQHISSISPVHPNMPFAPASTNPNLSDQQMQQLHQQYYERLQVLQAQIQGQQMQIQLM